VEFAPNESARYLTFPPENDPVMREVPVGGGQPPVVVRHPAVALPLDAFGRALRVNLAARIPRVPESKIIYLCLTVEHIW